MNSFLPISLLLIFTVPLKSHGNLYNGRILPASSEPRDSLACFKTATVDFFQNLKEVVNETCAQDTQNEFKSDIIVRAKSYAYIMKNGPYKAQFEEGIKQAEEIGTRSIAQIKNCLFPICTYRKQEKVENFIRIFRKSSTECGDSNYLSIATGALGETCDDVIEKSTTGASRSQFQVTERRYYRGTGNLGNRENGYQFEDE